MSQKKPEQSFTEDELKKLGRDLGAKLKPGDCVLLDGELGAGKTTLAAAIIEGLAPGTQFLGSPTFPIINQYMLSRGEELHHIDVYRLEKENELKDAGIESLFYETSHILIVEWLDKFPAIKDDWEKYRGRNCLKIGIYRDEGQLRKIVY